MKKFIFTNVCILVVIAIYLSKNENKTEVDAVTFMKSEKIISGDAKNKLEIRKEIFKQVVVKNEKSISSKCLVSIKEMLEETELTLPEELSNCEDDFNNKSINLEFVEEGADDDSKSTLFRALAFKIITKNIPYSNMAKDTLLYVAMGTREKSKVGREELGKISEELRFRDDLINSYQIDWRRIANSSDEELIKANMLLFVEESITNKNKTNFPYIIKVLSKVDHKDLANKIISELETGYEISMELFLSKAIFEKYFKANNAEIVLSFLRKAYEIDSMNNLLLKSIDSYENEAKPKLYLSYSSSISF